MKATFMMAPRELSHDRLTEIVRPYLAKGNVILGVSEEVYVEGFEDQPQFKMLRPGIAEELAEKIERAALPHTALVLVYPQNEVDDIVRAIRPARVIVVRGSYSRSFYLRSTYALLEKRGIPFVYVSPFSSEDEAKDYLQSVEPSLPGLHRGEKGDESTMLLLAQTVAKRSFDYTYQVGAVLAERHGDMYEVIDAAANEVVPYQTFALHFGNSREDNLAPVNDANHYDTIHAEMNLLVRRGTHFAGKTLFLNMLPCPNCARVLSKTAIGEVVYERDHSEGYAVKLLEKAGIKTRKVEV